MLDLRQYLTHRSSEHIILMAMVGTVYTKRSHSETVIHIVYLLIPNIFYRINCKITEPQVKYSV